MKRAIMCAALGASMAMGVMTAARAEDGQMRVDLAGLNLDSTDGAKAALSRIHYSADVFCDDVAGRQSLEHQAAVRECVANMTRKSVDALHAPTVTALLQGRSTSEAPIAVAQK